MGIACLIAETPDYAVLYKAALTHTVPLNYNEDGSLLNWAARLFPETLAVHGKKQIEGGIVHRLDYETEGLVLLARTQNAFDLFQCQQKAGQFIKEYSAMLSKTEKQLSGFPPSNILFKQGIAINSGFRHFGPGRKAVRPVLLDQCEPSSIYRTEILAVNEEAGRYHCRVRLARGFRHQVRCHLAWLGYPLLGDMLYGGETSKETLALKACSLRFFDPTTGEERYYTV